MKSYKILKKIGGFFLIFCLLFSCTFNALSVPAYASSQPPKPFDWSDVGEAMKEIAKDIAVSAVRNGSYELGAVAGELIHPGLGGVAGPLFGGAVNGYLDYFDNASDAGSGKTESGDTINYYINRGLPTSYNSTTYNQTESRSIFNVQKTENNTYQYRWYNPITHNYDITNSYTYNTEYNMYNYTTYNVTNNYTTNYYIQDNRTYITYYIINTNENTGEKEETYLQLYYQLPDGRNSYNLKASDLKGVYFPSKYSKYVSNAEDDGTTLGLWHLDGDLKDSSYWENTAGNAYNNKYTDGLYTSGKLFSDNENDYLELKLDKVSLPSTWTLEWCEYLPNSGLTIEPIDNFSKLIGVGSYEDQSTSPLGFTDVYYKDSIFRYKITLNGYLGIDDGAFYESSSGSFVPYALVFQGGVYKFYSNGSLISEYNSKDISISLLGDHDTSINSIIPSKTFSSFSGLSVSSDSIRFYVSNEEIGTYRDSSAWLTFYCHRNGSIHDHRCCNPSFTYYFNAHKNAIIDEVRLSKGALYSGDSYVPSNQPYTTNSVLNVPEEPEKHEISFRTNTELSDVRFGGARQTYPTNGTIYVALDDNQKVESVQQYRQDGWYEIEASIYYGDKWELLKGFDLSKISIDPGEEEPDPDKPTDPDNPDKPVDPDNPDDKDEDSGFLGTIGKILSSILKGLGSFLTPLIEGIASLLEGIIGSISSVTSFLTGAFGDFLASAFNFIPEDIVNVVVLGISLSILATLIKILKG